MMTCRKKSLPLFLLLFLILTVSHDAHTKSKPKSSKNLWDYRVDYKNLYSLDKDIQIGTYYMERMKSSFKSKGVDLKKHSALRARIQRIVNKLASHSDRPGLPFEVHIFEAPTVVNAFCIPGGKIGVFTGLFDKSKGLVDIKNDNEIAAILAHEIAHATLRHSTRKATSQQSLSLVGSLLGSVIGEGGSRLGQAAFESMFTLGTTLFLPSYSRKHESEADRAGFYNMAKAKFNPQAAIDVWERAAARNKNPKKNKSDLFASHPSNGERAKKLRKWLDQANAIYTGSMSPPR